MVEIYKKEINTVTNRSASITKAQPGNVERVDLYIKLKNGDAIIGSIVSKQAITEYTGPVIEKKMSN